MMSTDNNDVRQTVCTAILRMAAVFAFLNFIPSFIIQSSNDDYMATASQDCYFRQAAISCLIICVVPAVDLMIEWRASIFGGLQASNKKSYQAINSSSVASSMRLTLVERTMFIIGIITIGGNASFPAVFQAPNSLQIYYGFSNCSTIMIICPILSYLCRVSPSWSPLRASLVASIVCVTQLISSLGVIDSYSRSYSLLDGLARLPSILSFVSMGIFFWISILAMLDMFPLYKKTTLTNGKQDEASQGQSHSNATSDSVDTSDLVGKSFRYFVISMHMLSAMIVLIVSCAWFSLPTTGTAVDTVSIIIYSILAATIIVFVLELRVRKVELTSALVGLLDAKKSYVRYISHEMRTPLNAATLGLNMVVTQMKKNRHPTQAEQELVETLSDIRLACSTAVDILNDLLSFEKLESGILDLHRENIAALKFMKEGIVMFSAQAKEKLVTLDLASTVDEKTLEWYPNAVPLRTNDEFSCDRFKMDQVQPLAVTCCGRDSEGWVVGGRWVVCCFLS